MSDIRITSDERDNRAQEYYDLWEKAVKPEYDVREPTPVDAPYRNAADQPSYYPPGRTAVVGTAIAGLGYSRASVKWTLKTVWRSHLEDYGLDGVPVPDYALGGARFGMSADPNRVNILRAGDDAPWEFDVGQHRMLRRHRPPEPCNIQSHATEVVLTHLDTRPIICKDFHQAQRECERVGKTILR